MTRYYIQFRYRNNALIYVRYFAGFEYAPFGADGIEHSITSKRNEACNYKTKWAAKKIAKQFVSYMASRHKANIETMIIPKKKAEKDLTASPKKIDEKIYYLRIKDNNGREDYFVNFNYYHPNKPRILATSHMKNATSYKHLIEARKVKQKIERCVHDLKEVIIVQRSYKLKPNRSI